MAFIFYTINIYESVMVLGGYAASLEEDINNRIRAKVLKWEHELSPKFGHFNLSSIYLIIAGLGVSLGAMFFSFNRVFFYYRRSLFILI